MQSSSKRSKHFKKFIEIRIPTYSGCDYSYQQRISGRFLWAIQTLEVSTISHMLNINFMFHLFPYLHQYVPGICSHHISDPALRSGMSVGHGGTNRACTHTKIIGVLLVSTAFFIVSWNSYIKITACVNLCRSHSGDICVKVLKERSLTTQFLAHSSHNTGRDNIELPAPTEQAAWSK